MLVPGGTQRNRKAAEPSVEWTPELQEHEKLLLCDAQTSGGLLIAVSENSKDALLAELESRGVSEGAVVGRITDDDPGTVQVVS